MADSNQLPQDFPIPPASFEFLVESVLMQTQMQLGLLHLRENDEPAEPNLPLAKHSIDMLAMLAEKTRGNLTSEEQRLLENGLTELRFRFVQVADELKKAAKDEPRIYVPEGAGAEKKEEDGPRIITPDGGKGSKTS